jgi:hypothetical protein
VKLIQPGESAGHILPGDPHDTADDIPAVFVCEQKPIEYRVTRPAALAGHRQDVQGSRPLAHQSELVATFRRHGHT